MAGNMSSGNVLPFKIGDKELEKLIKQYKQDLKDDVFERASWPHFCGYLGYMENEVADVIRRGEEVGGAYRERAVMLKRMATWIRGEMMSGKGWGGQNQSKAIFALQQDFGDGTRYTNYRGNDGANTTGAIKIEFGNGDSRAKKAAK